MLTEYVQHENRVYRVAGTRVSLDSVVYGFLGGESPESIAQNFPALSLEQVYGWIAYYLANRATICRYLENGKAEFDRLSKEARAADPILYKKLAQAKRLLPNK